MNPAGVNTALPVAFYDSSPNIRVYLSRAELTPLVVETLQRHEAAQTPIFRDILALPGVVQLVGKPYEAFVQKATLYSFDELHTHIIALLLAVNLVPLQSASEAMQ